MIKVVAGGEGHLSVLKLGLTPWEYHISLSRQSDFMILCVMVIRPVLLTEIVSIDLTISPDLLIEYSGYLNR